MTDVIRNGALVVSTVLVVGSIIPYLIDIVKKKTKPRVVTWLNWGILGAIAGAAALKDGQIPAALLSFASVIEVGMVVLLGLYYGDRRFGRFDILTQIAAIIGLILWLVFNSPLTAIVAVTVIDLIAALPTYKHIWQSPTEETLSTFCISAVASLITLLVSFNANVSGLIFPIYLLTANVGMAGLIIARRRRPQQ